jgi:hypothetical protein
MHDLIQADLIPPSRLAIDARDIFSDAAPEERGAVHTRPEIAEFILDLVGWCPGKNLRSFRLLEPSAGEGDFLVPAVERLIAQVAPDDLGISDCICAVEVNCAALHVCRDRLTSLLLSCGWSNRASASLLEAWLHHEDFLSVPLEADFSHIVGNPPYLRLEKLPKVLLKAYRARWRSLFDRADLYVAFIEKSLGLLRPDGRLGFICADRWMKNRYGGPLREIIARDFHLDAYVDFTGCPAFLDEVAAYPAVTVIRKGHGETTRAAFRPAISRDQLAPLARALVSHEDNPQVTRLAGVCRGDAPWAIDEFGVMPVIRKLEAKFPSIESADCKVGIGVATGADAVFIGPAEKLDVEAERRLPLITTKDIRHGWVAWGGLYVLNPFGADGRLVDPDAYPKFRAYIEAHRAEIAKRNVSQRNPSGWFRTIDRIHAPLASMPKLLIPDIKGHAHVVLEEGQYYPHHNLYFITSESWELRILQMILSSRVAHAFVAVYSPRLRGNFLRFQAQYLRRIRLPLWKRIDEALQEDLYAAASSGSNEVKDEAVRRLYKLTPREWTQLESGVNPR